MGKRDIFSHIRGDRNGTWETVRKNMRTIRYPLAIPKPLYPNIFPYIRNREETTLKRSIDLYRQTDDAKVLRDQKSSDVLSILASGASINELTDQDFECIDSTDSIALNWWGVYHDFVPDFYKFEFMGVPELDTQWINEINKKSVEYDDTTLIFDPERLYNEGDCVSDYLYRFDPILRKNLVDIRVFPYFVSSDVGFCAEIIDYLYPTVLWNRFLHYRGSLSQALSLGEYMGYDEIILFGVDLNDSEYFWGEHPVWEYKERPDPDQEHVTAADREFKGIDDFIRTLDGEILPERGIDLYIGSKQSELYPDLPYFREVFI